MRLFLPLLVCGLSACTPVDKPSGVPANATAHWGLKGGFHWTWVQELERGCAKWMATDGWAAVTIIVDEKCDAGRESDPTVGRGVSYFSVEGHLTFIGYWPWSQEEYLDLIEFDEHGMVVNVRPCPYSLGAQQIDELAVVAQQAFADSETDGERRLLTHVRQRLAALDGASLASGQSGCTDYDASVERRDVWKRD